MHSRHLNSQPEKTLQRAFLVTLLVTCTYALSANNADPDFWGHVQYGRDALREGLPETNTYSYTAVGHRWINHENLTEFAFAIGVDWLGPWSLLVLKSLLGLLVLSMIYRQIARQQVSMVVGYLLLILVAANLTYFWTLRPQMFTYTYFTLMIAVLTYVFAPWQPGLSWILRLGRPRTDDQHRQLTGELAEVRQRTKWLWLLVPLIGFWTNTHGGFVAGLCILIAYLGCRGLELLAYDWRATKNTVAQFAAVALACGLVTFVNPYGSELHGWLKFSLGQPRPEIIEWRPPSLTNWVWIPWWTMAAVTVLTAVFSRKPRDFTHFVLLSLTLWQSIEHRRHIAFFAILFGFFLPMHVQSALSWLRARRKQQDTAPKPLSLAGQRLMLGATVACALLMVVQLAKQNSQIPVPRGSYPVSAFEYIVDQQLTGKLVVDFAWAQYAIAALSPKTPEETGLLVAFDGRFRTCYPQEMVDMYFDFALGDKPGMRHRSHKSPPEIDGRRLLEFGNPDLVLINRKHEHCVQVMQQCRDEWVVLYQDELAQLWGRVHRYDDPSSPHYIPPSARVLRSTPQTGVVAWPAIPTRRSAPTQLAAHSS